MKCRVNLSCSVLTFLILEIFSVICVSSIPRDKKASATPKINVESTTSNYKFINGIHSTITPNEIKINANLTEVKVKDDEGFDFFSRGFLNWIYPNPSTLKQAFYRWFFNGIIMGGVFVQYDTVKRQILVTLSKILTQWKIEKAERDRLKEEAQLYYSNYNQPYDYPNGYQNHYSEYQASDYDVKEEKPEYQPLDGDVKEEKPEYQPLDGDVKEEKPEYQPLDSDVKEEKPEYQPAKGDIKEEESDYQQSSYTSNDNRLIEKRHQYLGGEYSDKPNIRSTSVKERLISLTDKDKVCFQKGLCQLEKLSSISPSMASLWSEIRRDFSSNGAIYDHPPNQPRHLNCDKMFASCHVSTFQLIKFLLQ